MADAVLIRMATEEDLPAMLDIYNDIIVNTTAVYDYQPHTLGLHTILAGIDASNESSLKLHQHFGFEEVAHFKQVGWKFDRWLDLKFLQLIIGQSQK